MQTQPLISDNDLIDNQKKKLTFSDDDIIITEKKQSKSSCFQCLCPCFFSKIQKKDDNIISLQQQQEQKQISEARYETLINSENKTLTYQNENLAQNQEQIQHSRNVHSGQLNSAGSNHNISDFYHLQKKNNKMASYNSDKNQLSKQLSKDSKKSNNFQQQNDLILSSVGFQSNYLQQYRKNELIFLGLNNSDSDCVIAKLTEKNLYYCPKSRDAFSPDSLEDNILHNLAFDENYQQEEYNNQHHHIYEHKINSQQNQYNFTFQEKRQNLISNADKNQNFLVNQQHISNSNQQHHQNKFNISSKQNYKKSNKSSFLPQFLFSQYDAIKIRPDFHYQVTPEIISEYIAQRAKSCPFVIDAFCGVGGNTIQFSKQCDLVLANDFDQNCVESAQYNWKIYNKNLKNVEFILGDYFDLQKVKADLVFLSPSISKSFEDDGRLDLFENFIPELLPSLKLAFQQAANIMLFLPSKADISQIPELFSKLFDSFDKVDNTSIEIESIYVNESLEYYLIHYGAINNGTVQLCLKNPIARRRGETQDNDFLFEKKKYFKDQNNPKNFNKSFDFENKNEKLIENQTKYSQNFQKQKSKTVKHRVQFQEAKNQVIEGSPEQQSMSNQDVIISNSWQDTGMQFGSQQSSQTNSIMSPNFHLQLNQNQQKKLFNYKNQKIKQEQYHMQLQEDDEDVVFKDYDYDNKAKLNRLL
ncbi:hypothetical protein PPERSA_05930 [Pseudocohnilembus persalinus]|uniref:Trimethylguanosine synthase n=1 Tax=Pseudocohnilembus persalinus TaxID=266149 RepID=A0A0V0R449_PSEPJ|nr:hypothetical protein PPERSA_05930 [Pseudocohnilembus persalinus]|eukprot:KRX09261.1 hypothetical protein PPERSA_05930 [Pseudocohnilembus persalinus]